MLACKLMVLAQPRGELGLAAVHGNTERRPTVAREGGRFCRADGGGALRFRPGKGRFLEPRVQEAHAGDIVSARLLPFGLDRLPVLVALEGAHLDGSRRIEQIGQSGLSRFRHTPRPGAFAANAVAVAGLPLEDEDSQAGSGQYPTEGRFGVESVPAGGECLARSRSTIGPSGTTAKRRQVPRLRASPVGVCSPPASGIAPVHVWRAVNVHPPCPVVNTPIFDLRSLPVTDFRKFPCDSDLPAHDARSHGGSSRGAEMPQKPQKCGPESPSAGTPCAVLAPRSAHALLNGMCLSSTVIASTEQR